MSDIVHKLNFNLYILINDMSEDHLVDRDIIMPRVWVRNPPLNIFAVNFLRRRYMSKSSSGSIISLPTIIFLVVMYNVFFDDDEDKKEVEIKSNDQVVVEETIDKPSLKDQIVELGEQAKDVAENVISTAKEEIDERQKEETQSDTAHNQQEEKEEAPEKEAKVETLEPLEKEEPQTGMKKL